MFFCQTFGSDLVRCVGGVGCLVLGIQVVVEVGLGLGVFAGDALGIGNSVRQLSAGGLNSVWIVGEVRRSDGNGNHWNIYGIYIYIPCDHHVIHWMTSLTSPSWRSMVTIYKGRGSPSQKGYEELPGSNILGIIGWILIGQSNGAD